MAQSWPYTLSQSQTLNTVALKCRLKKYVCLFACLPSLLRASGVHLPADFVDSSVDRTCSSVHHYTFSAHQAVLYGWPNGHNSTVFEFSTLFYHITSIFVGLTLRSAVGFAVAALASTPSWISWIESRSWKQRPPLSGSIMQIQVLVQVLLWKDKTLRPSRSSIATGT